LSCYVTSWSLVHRCQWYAVFMFIVSSRWR